MVLLLLLLHRCMHQQEFRSPRSSRPGPGPKLPVSVFLRLRPILRQPAAVLPEFRKLPQSHRFRSLPVPLFQPRLSLQLKIRLRLALRLLLLLLWQIQLLHR